MKGRITPAARATPPATSHTGTAGQVWEALNDLPRSKDWSTRRDGVPSPWNAPCRPSPLTLAEPSPIGRSNPFGHSSYNPSCAEFHLGGSESVLGTRERRCASRRIESVSSARSCRDCSSSARSRKFKGDHGGALELLHGTDASSGRLRRETEAVKSAGCDIDSGSDLRATETVGVSTPDNGLTAGTSSAELVGRERVTCFRAGMRTFGPLKRLCAGRELSASRSIWSEMAASAAKLWGVQSGASGAKEVGMAMVLA